MKGNDYRKAFEAARKEHEQLDQESKRIDARKTHLQQLMVSLSPLLDEDPPEVHTGLMDAIRQTLRAAGDVGLRPPELHAHLKSIGLELPKSNPLAAIHVTLKRLINSGEVKPYRDDAKVKKYRWVGKNITVHVPTGTVTLSGVSATGDLGFLTAQSNAHLEQTANYLERYRDALHRRATDPNKILATDDGATISKRLAESIRRGQEAIDRVTKDKK